VQSIPNTVKETTHTERNMFANIFACDLRTCYKCGRCLSCQLKTVNNIISDKEGVRWLCGQCARHAIAEVKQLVGHQIGGQKWNISIFSVLRKAR
jgi:hypothetical protein